MNCKKMTKNKEHQAVVKTIGNKSKTGSSISIKKEINKIEIK